MTNTGPAATSAMPLEGRIAAVTGAASGIGFATALALLQAGASVAAADHDEARLTAAVATMMEQVPPGTRATVSGFPVDVRRESEVDAYAGAVLQRFGQPDALICCAGILRPRGLPPSFVVDMKLAEWDAVVETNLRGIFLVNRAFLRGMIARRGGHIINISSTAGLEGRAYDAAYCASKSGVIGLTESLAEEVRRSRIKVTAILPDAVATPLWQQNAPIPAPAVALAPERVADLIVYLLGMPDDVILVNPVIKAFSPRRQTGAGPRDEAPRNAV